MENINRLVDVLNYPIAHKIPELMVIIDRCSIRELQEFFPSLINSIFNGVGWGLRTTTRELNSYEFDILYNFFNPMGPMFTLCYRLLNDALKFDIPISKLPTNMRQVLESGRYSLFYSDLISFDAFSRQITHVSLNAFDYFMLHFAIHAMLSLHNNYYLAMRIHTDKLKTVYFTLTADYLCAFLPSSPEVVIYPQDICGTVKSSPPIQINTIRPSRSPVYIQLSALSRHKPVQSARVNEASPRNNAWRTESVMYMFIDTWLRYNFDESRDLPSSEFIRVVRVLVKQVHTFGNSAEIDNTSMSELRKIAQPMMSAQMFPFLRRIIDRWPLDCSFLIVLELWLSYIQPWRYTYDRDLNSSKEITLSRKFDLFIQENLQDYTQIFVQLLPRYDRLDLSSLKSVLMLYRLVKVFSQPDLGNILQYTEDNLASPVSPRSLNISPLKALDRKRPNLIDSSYQFLFRPPATETIRRLIKRVQSAERKAQTAKTIAEIEAKQKYSGVWNYIRCMFLETDEISDRNLLQDKQRLPEILHMISVNLSLLFNLDVSDTSLDPLETVQQDDEENTTFSTFNYSEQNSFERSMPSPLAMRSRVPTYTGDPALIPIRNNEVTWLVRFLHQLSCKINGMFSNELQKAWNRQDAVGKLIRPLLSPPMTAQYIEKSKGYSSLRNENLGPRVNLRALASYGNLTMVFVSLLFGQFFFQRPTYGLILLIGISLSVCYLRFAFTHLRSPT